MATADPIKVYDARWEVHEFDDQAVGRLFEATLAYARELKIDTLTLARDARLGAGRVLEIALHKALDKGFKVYLNTNPISTPHSYFMTHTITRQRPATMGLTITASHNPANYVGVKFTVPTVQAIGLDCGPSGGLARIRDHYHSGDTCPDRPDGKLELIDLTREYAQFSLQQAGIKPGQLKGLRVVLDTFHGSAGPEMLTVLEQAGVEVHTHRLIPDGHFPTGSPNPTSVSKMDTAIAMAEQLSAHAVIGMDGDGDRLVFGDRRGILSAGFASIPILRACGLDGSSPRQPVLYDPKVNPLALSQWSELGAKPILFRNGHSQIKDYMRQVSALAAAEESGHYYHRVTLDGITAWYENSLMTALLFLEAIHRQPMLFDELWQFENSLGTTGEFNYQFPDNERGDKALAAVIDHFTSQGAETVTATPDGIDLQGTVLFKGMETTESAIRLSPGWFSGYVRAATNEPGVVRAYFSADAPEQCDKIERQTREIMEKLGGTITE